MRDRENFKRNRKGLGLGLGLGFDGKRERKREIPRVYIERVFCREEERLKEKKKIRGC